jgi:ATP-dependent helicase/nuclease subunit A
MSLEHRSSTHTVMAASAGSGKTFQLTGRYLRLVLDGESPTRILATTFTRKAAAEILGRLLSRLAAAAMDPKSAAKLGSELGIKLDVDRALDRLAAIVRDLHRLQVSTLDGFVQRFAASSPFEIGLPPGWRIAEEVELAKLRTQALRRVLASGDRDDLVRIVRLLSRGNVDRSVESQIDAILKDQHALLRDAPGSAWTWMRRETLDPLLVAQIVGDLESVELPTDKRIAKAVTKLIGVARAADWKEFLEDTLAEKSRSPEPKYHGKALPGPLVVLIRELTAHAEAIYWNREIGVISGLADLIGRFDSFREEIQRRRRGYAFEDITRAVARRIASGGMEELEYRLDEQIAHLLLDEFQDTSDTQWRVIAPIADEILAWGDGSKTFFCVGDRKQSIYEWRNARPEIFDSVCDRDGIDRVPLARSFRSAPPIIETVNRVFAGLDQAEGLQDEKYRPAVIDWTRRFDRHETARTELTGYVELIVAREPGGVESASGSARNSRRRHEVIPHAAERVAEIAQRIGSHRVAVLVRKRERLARMIVALRELGVRASEEGKVSLADDPAVKAFLSLLRFADHPADRVARYHAATSPLGAIVGLGANRSPGNDGNIARRIRRELVDRGYGPTIENWVDGVAIATSEISLRRLVQLIDVARDFDTSATLRPGDFVDHVRSLALEDPAEDAVRVLTYHGAKGLEFDWVVLPDLEDRLIGQSPKLIVERDAEGTIVRIAPYLSDDLRDGFEETRSAHAQHFRRRTAEALSVLYVALTRAKRALTMVVPAETKRESATYASILVSTLVEDGVALAPDSCVHANGDPNWETREAYANGEAPARTKAPPLGPIVLAPRQRPIRGHDAPSTLEAGPNRRLRERFRLDDDGRKLWGTAFHALFETIGWLEDGTPSDDELIHAISPRIVSRSDAAEIVAELRSALASDNVSDALARTAAARRARVPEERLELERERPFACRIDERILRGRFDRVVTMREDGRVVGAEIIDFKTDDVEDGDSAAASKRFEIYRPQLAAYRSAGARIWRLEPSQIRARLVFVRARSVIDLESE